MNAHEKSLLTALAALDPAAHSAALISMNEASAANLAEAQKTNATATVQSERALKAAKAAIEVSATGDQIVQQLEAINQRLADIEIAQKKACCTVS